MSDSSDHKKNENPDETTTAKTYIVKPEFHLDTASLDELAELIMERDDRTLRNPRRHRKPLDPV